MPSEVQHHDEIEIVAARMKKASENAPDHLVPVPVHSRKGHATPNKMLLWGVLFVQKCTQLGQKPPTQGVWRCCCTEDCQKEIQQVAVPGAKNGRSKHQTVLDHLANQHAVMKQEDHSSYRNSEEASELAAEETRAVAILGSTERYYSIRIARATIKKALAFSFWEDFEVRAVQNRGARYESAQSVRRHVGEQFWEFVKARRATFEKVHSNALLPCYHLNADLWTSKITNKKYLGVRIFYPNLGKIQSTLLACTLYNPPAPPPGTEKSRASEIVLKYIFEVLSYYSVPQQKLAGATSDGGSDLKRAFDVLAREQIVGFQWSWCIPHLLHCALQHALGTDKDPRMSKNKECRAFINSLRKVIEHFSKSPESMAALVDQQLERQLQRGPTSDEQQAAAYILEGENGGKVLKLLHNVSQRWSSSIDMLERMLFLWESVSGASAKRMREFPLTEQNEEYVQLYSLVQPVGVLMAEAQGTTKFILVKCVYLIIALWQQTLNPDEQLIAQHPREQEKQKFGSFSQDKLTPLVRSTRLLLSAAVEERLLERYALKKHALHRAWWWDMGMWLYPPLANNMKHVNILLNLRHTTDERWTKDEVEKETKERIVQLMTSAALNKHKRSQQRSDKAARNEAPGGTQNIAAALFTASKRQLQAPEEVQRGGRDASKRARRGGSNVNTQLKGMESSDEDEDGGGADGETRTGTPSFKVQADRELTRYLAVAKMTTSKPEGRSGYDTVLPENLEDWLQTRQQEFPLLYAVFSHVQTHIVSSAQIERDFSAASHVLPATRNQTEAVYFQAQLICLLNFENLVSPCNMPQKEPTIEEMNGLMPADGFGADIYSERRPMPDADPEMEGWDSGSE